MYIIKKEVICVVLEYRFDIYGRYLDFKYEVEQREIEEALLQLGKATERELTHMDYDEFLELCEEETEELHGWFWDDALDSCQQQVEIL